MEDFLLHLLDAAAVASAVVAARMASCLSKDLALAMGGDDRLGCVPPAPDRGEFD